MYWRPKFWGRNFGLKLKFFYTNQPLGTRKWHQNCNLTPNKTFLFVKLQTDRSIHRRITKKHHLDNLKLLAILKMLFFWSIWPVFSFNLAYCRPNSVKYVKLDNLSNTWQSLHIHPVEFNYHIRWLYIWCCWDSASDSSFKSVSRAERPFSKMTLGNFSILLLTQIPVAWYMWGYPYYHFKSGGDLHACICKCLFWYSCPLDIDLWTSIMKRIWLA